MVHTPRNQTTSRPHFAPRKRFGQHFLRDEAVIAQIVAAAAPRRGDRLVEIGPGDGALTRPLLPLVERLEAVELDRDLAAPLQRRCAGLGELRLHIADALRFDFAALTDAERSLRVVGNLPYNISTPLLFHLLDSAQWIDDMHLMLQKEVAARLTAAPGENAYGRLSVMARLRCEAEQLFDVAPSAFHPPPAVTSSVVRLTPWRQPPVVVADEARLARVVATAFAQRRKTLRNALRELLTEGEIRAAGVDPGARAETLSVTQFAALAAAPR